MDDFLKKKDTKKELDTDVAKKRKKSKKWRSSTSCNVAFVQDQLIHGASTGPNF